MSVECDQSFYEQTRAVMQKYMNAARTPLDMGEQELAFAYINKARGAHELWFECASMDAYEKYNDELSKLLESHNYG